MKRIVGVAAVVIVGLAIVGTTDDDSPKPEHPKGPIESKPVMVAMPDVMGMPGLEAQALIKNRFVNADVTINDSIHRDGCYSVYNRTDDPLPEGWMLWPVAEVYVNKREPLLPENSKIYVRLSLDPGDTLPCEQSDYVYGGDSGNLPGSPGVNLPNPDKPVICRRGPLKKFC